MTQDQLPPLATQLQNLGVQYGGTPGIGGYSTPPGSPGTDWATQIQQSQPGMTGPATTEQTTSSPLIYLGPAGQLAPGTVGPVASNITDIDTLLEDFEKMSHKEQRRLALLLVIGGFGPGVELESAAATARDMTLSETLEAYVNLLDVAAGRYAKGQQVTPEAVLEQYVAYRLPRKSQWDGSFSDLVDILHENEIDTNGIEQETDKPVDLSGTRSTTATSTSVTRDIMDPNDAMALTRSLLQRELGRDPTKAEFEDFISAVQAAQRQNPSRTTSTTTRTVTTGKKGRVLDQDTDTSTTRNAGIGAAGVQDLMLRKARSNPDWAEWQAVGTYAPALFQALGATVPGV